MLTSSHSVTGDNIVAENELKANWTLNLRTGENLNSEMFPEGFLTIPQEQRDQIVAMHFVVGNKKFSINRKITINEEIHYLDGFFYHILAGKRRMFADGNIPFMEERFGFCYNSKGDAAVVYFDHMNFWRELQRKGDKLYEMKNNPKTANNKSEIKRVENDPVNYQTKIKFYTDNIVQKRVNHALFGKLEDLPEESIALPTVTETVEEVING